MKRIRQMMLQRESSGRAGLFGPGTQKSYAPRNALLGTSEVILAEDRYDLRIDDFRI